MKNLWVIPTDKKPIKGDLLLRHLWKGTPLECISWWRYNETTTLGDTVVYSTLNGSFADTPSSFKTQQMYITNDEEIKEGDWYASLIVDEKTKWETTKLDCVVKADLNKTNKYLVEPFSKYCKKIILTTDQELIADGVQAIYDEFLEWFVKNTSCEEVEVKPYHIVLSYLMSKKLLIGYRIIIPKEEPKQDFYKIGDFDKNCDDGCKYHCTKGNTQLAECLKEQNKMEQTAVEWFADRIKHGGLVSNKQFDELLNQAKEMFEKQIINAWNDGLWGKLREGEDNAEAYYNETFKQ